MLLSCPRTQEQEAEAGTAPPALVYPSVGAGEGEPGPGRPFQHTRCLFSSWRLWDPPAAGQGASLRCRVQIQGEGPRGGRAWGGVPWALLGQDCCWPGGRKRWGHLCSKRSCQHMVPLKILALAVAGSCSALKAGAWCCSITWVGDQSQGLRNVVFGVTVCQGCPEGDVCISLCASSSSMSISPTERQRRREEEGPARPLCLHPPEQGQAQQKVGLAGKGTGWGMGSNLGLMLLIVIFCGSGGSLPASVLFLAELGATLCQHAKGLAVPTLTRPRADFFLQEAGENAGPVQGPGEGRPARGQGRPQEPPEEPAPLRSLGGSACTCPRPDNTL